MFGKNSQKLNLSNQVWDEIEDVVREQKDVINFGHGYSDYFPPKFVTESLKEVATNPSSYSIHQYSRREGHLRLVEALARVKSPGMGRVIDPVKEVLITIGATHALYCAITSLVTPNDEPYYILYDNVISSVGGISVPVNLTVKEDIKQTQTKFLSSADFKFDEEELASKFNERTKLFILNNPNNPVGKVFTREELMVVANLCIKHNVIVVSDEVYEKLVYPPNEHIAIASLPGMWERTITIGSAGKTFSVTGWKLGWCIAHEALLSKAVYMHKISAYNVPTPLQEAVAICIEKAYLDEGKETIDHDNVMCKESKERVMKVAEMCRSVGMVPFIPDGGFFILADISNVEFDFDPKNKHTKDVQLVTWMVKHCNIATIPITVFVKEESQDISKDLIRFACCKKNSTLEKAELLFSNWRKKQQCQDLIK